MSERKSIKVSQEEIEAQRKYIEEIKEINHRAEMVNNRRKKYYLVTFGCQMNENDSERLSGMLNEMGYSETDNSKDSDLIIYNTCCVRENAELKVYGHLGALKKLKREKPELIIAVCGCMMQQKEVVEFINKKHKHVDLIFGTHNLYRFPELLRNSFMESIPYIEVWDKTGNIYEGMPIERKGGIKAWVTIMYGCDNFCSYCIVPYVRGRERSRSVEDIVREVTALGQEGYKEITLLGQNVNSYGKDLEENYGFSDLLRQLNEVPGIERIRFMTSHPKDLSQEVINAVRDLPKVMKHIHLPIQSGSTRILKEMNRSYTKEYYLELAGRIKTEIPGISMTTDIIVGFPGETEEDFNETLDILERVKFDSAYTFLYSKRTGTPAAKYNEQIPDSVMKERFERLTQLQNRISRELNDELLGSVQPVLVEGLSKNSKSTYTGRTGTNKIVNFKGSSELIGKITKVKIEKVLTWSLEGVLMESM